jgi:hypothetical protein
MTTETFAAHPDVVTHQAMSEALVQRGVITSEQAAESRAALEAQLAGVAPEPSAPLDAAAPKPVTDQSPVVPSPQDGGLDASIFAAPSSPASYNLGGVPEGEEADLAFEQASREAMHHAGVPASIGTAFGKLWAEAMTRELPSEDQLRQARQDTYAALHKQWGADTDANLKLARGVLARMAERQPALPEALTLTGLGNNRFIIESLVNIAKARGGR